MLRHGGMRAPWSSGPRRAGSVAAVHDMRGLRRENMAARCGGWVLALACGGLMATLGAARAQTQVYDAVADFSLSSNPNGVWSYLAASMPMSSTTTALNGLQNWDGWINGASGTASASVARDHTGKAIHYSSIVLPKNELFLDAGTSPSVMIVFTALRQGVYHIRARLHGIDRLETSHVVAVGARGYDLCSTTIGNFRTVINCHRTIALKVGDNIEIISGGATGKNQPHVSTGLTLIIRGPISKPSQS